MPEKLVFESVTTERCPAAARSSSVRWTAAGSPAPDRREDRQCPPLRRCSRGSSRRCSSSSGGLSPPVPSDPNARPKSNCTPVRFASRKYAPSNIAPDKIAPVRLAPSRFAFVRVRAFQVGVGQVGFNQVCAYQDRSAKVGTSQVETRHVQAGEVAAKQGEPAARLGGEVRSAPNPTEDVGVTQLAATTATAIRYTILRMNIPLRMSSRLAQLQP